MTTHKPWEHAKGDDGGSEGDPLAARFVASLDYDTRLYKVDIRGSIAHARMLAQVGLITAEELGEIERGLKEIETEIEAAPGGIHTWPGWKIELEDVHMCIEAALIEKTGDAGRKLHTGRSRNDQVATDLVLWLNDARNGIEVRLSMLETAFYELAQRQGHLVMPSYTHLQRAQPIVVGGEAVAWASAFSRMWKRIELDSLHAAECPLGSGAIAGSSLPLDRQAAIELLESVLLNPSKNSIESTASRDVAIDFVYALSMTAMWLSRWAEQWIIYAGTEFGFITLDAKYTTGSSMMPQKQNPDMLELIRGRCGNVYGNLVALLTICKGLTIGYNRDLQEDKRHVFAAYDTVSDCLEMAARIVASTRFNEEKIRAGLDRGYLDATSLAEYLVTKGVPFRTAHQIVGAMVHHCEKTGRYKLEQLKVDEMNQLAGDVSSAAKVVADDVYDWLGPDNVVKRYQTTGNAGISGFEQQLEAWRSRSQ